MESACTSTSLKVFLVIPGDSSVSRPSFSCVDVLKMAAHDTAKTKKPANKEKKQKQRVSTSPRKRAMRAMRAMKKKQPAWLRISTQLCKHVFISSKADKDVWAHINGRWCLWMKGLWVPKVRAWQSRYDHEYMV